MDWPLKTPAVSESEIPILNSYYLKACPTPSDPTIVWGTDVEVTGLRDFVRTVNDGNGLLVTGAHVLLKAVGQALVQHPRFNRRVLGRRLYEFRDVNILMPLQNRRTREPEVFLLRRVDTLSLTEIARQVWDHHRNTTRQDRPHDFQAALHRRLPRRLVPWLFRLLLRVTNRFHRPITRLNEQLVTAPVMVNDFSHLTAPMRSYKPSRFPTDSLTLTVTMGPGEHRLVVVDGRIRICHVAPLFVRADHRVVDAHELGQFVETLRRFLADPLSLESISVSPGASPGRQCPDLIIDRRPIGAATPPGEHCTREQSSEHNRTRSAPLSQQT